MVRAFLAYNLVACGVLIAAYPPLPSGYVKKGDALTLTFDSTVKALRQMEVNTWLGEPESAVNLTVTMQSMPEGISHSGTIVFALPKRQLEVRITKSNDQKIAQ